MNSADSVLQPDWVTDPDPPTVTVVIPMRNEATSIGRCLESVRANRLPPDSLVEILVLDGASTDGSADLVQSIAQGDQRIRLIDNPDRIQAAAFNRALELARGTWFIRMDAHAEYEPDYLAECVRLLETTGAGNVGGVQRAVGTTWLTRAIATAVSSRFAAGDARYRNATEPGETDTVYLGAWRTDTLRALGGMRTDWAVNEDYELNVRLRATGRTVYLSPTIRSTYHVRGSLRQLARQYLRYGFWKVRTLLEHPESLRWRQLVAPAFVLSLLLTPVFVGLVGWWGISHLVLYAAANLTASAVAARPSGASTMVILPIIYFIVHCGWGMGFLGGLVWWPWHRNRSSGASQG